MYTISDTQEYKKLDKTSSIGVVVMFKNEKLRIGVTLESIKDFADALICYDTGSTDDSPMIVSEFCKKNKINLYMIKGEFVNYSVSRNILLDYADTIDVEFLVLLDVNDELRFGKELRDFCKTQEIKPREEVIKSCFLVEQQWWSGVMTNYFNTRLLRARCGWRYVGSVHEYIKCKDMSHDESSKFQDIVPKPVIIYQDRTKDDDKSLKRFSRDKELLLADHKKNPEDPRSIFYLAQTCACLQQNEEALYYYRLRCRYKGFYEEIFQAYLKNGEICENFNCPWEVCMSYYIKALEIANYRVEPYIRIAIHYTQEKNWILAYTFIRMACNLDYPSHCRLFVDAKAYAYTRWHCMSIIGYYSGVIEEGRDACIKACESEFVTEQDRKNLEIYNETIRKIKAGKGRDEFLKETEAKFLEKLGPERAKEKALSIWMSLSDIGKPK